MKPQNNLVCDKNEFTRHKIVWLILMTEETRKNSSFIHHSAIISRLEFHVSQRTSFFSLRSRRTKNYNFVQKQWDNETWNKNHFHIYRLMPLEDWANLYFSFRTPQVDFCYCQGPQYHFSSLIHSCLIEVLIKNVQEKMLQEKSHRNRRRNEWRVIDKVKCRLPKHW